MLRNVNIQNCKTFLLLQIIKRHTASAASVLESTFYLNELKRVGKNLEKIWNFAGAGVCPNQRKMIILEAGDTALVLSQTLLDAEYSMDRRAT